MLPQQRRSGCFESLSGLLEAVFVHHFLQESFLFRSQRIGKFELIPISADKAHRQGAVRLTGPPIKTGVHIYPVIAGVRADMGPEYRVGIKIDGDVEIQFAIILCDLTRKSHRFHGQLLIAACEFGRLSRFRSSWA